MYTYTHIHTHTHSHTHARTHTRTHTYTHIHAHTHTHTHTHIHTHIRTHTIILAAAGNDSKRAIARLLEERLLDDDAVATLVANGVAQADAEAALMV